MKFSRQKKKSGPTADDNEGVGKESLKKNSEDGMNSVRCRAANPSPNSFVHADTKAKKRKTLFTPQASHFFFFNF